jgi:CrcB protein
MQAYLLVALGGALGSVARFAMASNIDARWSGAFPLGTLAVNTLGCLLIGLIAGLTDSMPARHLLMVGALGGFTTFSAFSLQSVELLKQHRYGVAIGYSLSSVIICVIATIAGLALARLIRSA